MADKSAYVPVEATSGGAKKATDLDIDIDDNDYFGDKKAQSPTPAPVAPPPPPPPPPPPAPAPAPAAVKESAGGKKKIVYKKPTVYQKTYAGRK
ncbi:unnamed protein product [Bursaphelenchus xylophilus]|uniref:(pine wood nematode) hypothetical protein n=1 Tax=Bursaphelenchus xylophilus TaxID=6326 RepID=A0A1I7RNR8_BURXY|nr:unnamed protein product [Bursaphelenchus xylophilus]CAG9124246.1 unnamed protein product [Bursaphelenchus xylophilus]